MNVVGCFRVLLPGCVEFGSRQDVAGDQDFYLETRAQLGAPFATIGNCGKQRAAVGNREE